MLAEQISRLAESPPHVAQPVTMERERLETSCWLIRPNVTQLVATLQRVGLFGDALGFCPMQAQKICLSVAQPAEWLLQFGLPATMGQ